LLGKHSLGQHVISLFTRLTNRWAVHLLNEIFHWTGLLAKTPGGNAPTWLILDITQGKSVVGVKTRPGLQNMLENGWGSLSSSTKPNQVWRIAILDYCQPGCIPNNKGYTQGIPALLNALLSIGPKLISYIYK